MATKSETDKNTPKAGIDFAKPAGADSIRDAYGSQCGEANAILGFATKENRLPCR